MWHTPSQPRRDGVRADELAAYDRVVARQAAYGYGSSQTGYEDARPPEQIAGPYFGALLASPSIADHVSELGVVYRSRGDRPDSYSHAEREWVDIVLGHELGYDMWPHIADGMAVGVRPEAVLAVLEDRDDELAPAELELALYVRAVARGTATAQDYQTMAARFGERGAIEFTAFIGHLIMTIRLCQAFSGYRWSVERIVEDVRRVMRGELELPDPRARIPQPERS
jgi:hypothetical protein